MKIYVVFGSTGDKYNHAVWPVEAFSKIEKAQTLVKLANSMAEYCLDDSYEAQQRKEGLYALFGRNPYDEKFKMDYRTGTKYYYSAFDLPLVSE